ncbi:MAG TPA: 2Fe-2S iron-sulfur cluster-binding protein [Thermodesulfobacteriota bacterium]|nr:2Fe-2S iron-sulfur cluster-binding protein [Thermodesulfobacteriota bacterium]
MIKISILRQDPRGGAEPRFQDFEIESGREMTVLQALQEIYSRLDPTLAFRRYRCGRRICGSCEVKLDGRIVRGCATLLHPGGNYRLEPARPGSVIRDLVFEFRL